MVGRYASTLKKHSAFPSRRPAIYKHTHLDGHAAITRRDFTRFPGAACGTISVFFFSLLLFRLGQRHNSHLHFDRMTNIYCVCVCVRTWKCVMRVCSRPPPRRVYTEETNGPGGGNGAREGEGVNVIIKFGKKNIYI